MKLKWLGLKRYMTVRRCGVRDGNAFDTVTFYISSEMLSAWCFAQRIRYHRKIENTLHWTKDVVLNEDNCGLVNSQQAANMAVIRDICFNLHVMSGYTSISQGISAVGEKLSTLWHMITGQHKTLI